MAIIDSIKNKLGEIIYPKTLTRAIYEEGTNRRLDTILSGIADPVDISGKADTAYVDSEIAELEHSELSSYATNLDANDIYVNSEWKRKDGTVYCRSTLLGTSPDYNQIRVDYCDLTGLTIDKTITWDLTYDGSGFSYQKVVV